LCGASLGKIGKENIPNNLDFPNPGLVFNPFQLICLRSWCIYEKYFNLKENRPKIPNFVNAGMVFNLLNNFLGIYKYTADFVARKNWKISGK
jgi:hypothetical protein